MKCKNCGCENEDSAKFCKNCGNNVFYSSHKNNKYHINPLLVIGLIIIILLVAIGGVFAYIVYFDNSPVELFTLSNQYPANILENNELASNIPNSEISNEIISLSNNGTVVYKIGDGDGPVTLITAGVHGDQLNPSLAAMELINYLNGRKIKGTVYVIPFVSPEAISKNTKLTNGINLNQVADESGSISYDIVQFAYNNQASAVGDFHETQTGKNPGVTTIMCSQLPNYNSYLLATNMSQLSEDSTMTFLVAGIEYDGAIEDELNLKQVPSVTPLVQVPSHGKIYSTSTEESLTQMLALLYANGNIDPDDEYLKLANADIDGFN